MIPAILTPARFLMAFYAVNIQAQDPNQSDEFAGLDLYGAELGDTAPYLQEIV